MAHLAREGEVEQICFLQCIAESCLISKNLENITKLPADIQKKWLEFYLEKLKLLKTEMSMDLWTSLKDRKWLGIVRYLISSLIVITDLDLLQKNFLKSKELILTNYSLQLSTIRWHTCFWLLLFLKIGISIVLM